MKVESLQMQFRPSQRLVFSARNPSEPHDDLSSPLHKRMKQKACIEEVSNSSNPRSLSFYPRTIQVC